MCISAAPFVLCSGSVYSTPTPSDPEILKAFLGQHIYKKTDLLGMALFIVSGKLTRDIEVKGNSIKSSPVILGPLQSRWRLHDDD
jgi:hypothetical protein